MAEPLPASLDDLDAVVRTLYGEARGTSLQAQQGVAWVIRNRAEYPSWWGRGIQGVCYAPQQFSCHNPNDPNCEKCRLLSTTDPEYKALFDVASSVMKGEIDDPTGSASHYFSGEQIPAWAKGHYPSALIEPFQFYDIGP